MTSSSASSAKQNSNTNSESLLNNLSNNLPANKESVDKNFKLELDKEGHLIDHSLWTPTVAQHLADTLSVTLTEEHYLILQQVRKFHVEFNHPPSTRPLIKYLMQTLPEMQISNQLLQQMFNTGLVARHVNRIAGLPKPPNCL
ncbi:TusE/DsrC/DsvC family sulfur relay protein [Psychrobacter sp.]|uniref:TusE/DsrC/DsvC family sulfur relay protein n=1 Tax=Psychrobacter sp. TaxID=56811 RepID=UPI0025EC72B5|nr:TusE/DsrC/DsvC family sulfur relay protein [Psychrobacter sp.]